VTPDFNSEQWQQELRDSDLAPRLQDLARLMASYADERGILRPSIEALRLAHVQDRGVGERLNAPRLHAKKTIERRVDSLVAAGWIERVEKGGISRDGFSFTTTYTLAFPTDSSYGQLLRTATVAHLRAIDLRPDGGVKDVGAAGLTADGSKAGA
jgi:hypothetical protein